MGLGAQDRGTLDDRHDAQHQAVVGAGPDATDSPGHGARRYRPKDGEDAADQRHDADGGDLARLLIRSAARARRPGGTGPIVVVLVFVVTPLARRRLDRRWHGRLDFFRRCGGEGILALGALHRLAQQLGGHLQMFVALGTDDQLRHGEVLMVGRRNSGRQVFSLFARETPAFYDFTGILQGIPTTTPRFSSTAARWYFVV